jgi:hypothetical protein
MSDEVVGVGRAAQFAAVEAVAEALVMENGSVSLHMYGLDACMNFAYGCDAIGDVVDFDIAAETASRRHNAGRTVWWCDFVVLVIGGYMLALVTH